MEDNTIKACVAIVCITALEIYALSQNINGTALAAVVGIIAGLGGYVLGKRKA